MIFEDAHWIDPTSLEVFGRRRGPYKNPSRVADRDVSGQSLSRRGLGGLTSHALTVNRLGEREVAAMIDARHR